VPVMVLTALFAWRYRASATSTKYDPDWHHSTALEVAIWSAPLTIIVALGALTWVSTHVLDPYRALSRTAPGHSAQGIKPLRVQVVALDWKWLFIYPDQGIATINEFAAPVGVPVDFQITSSHMMNSFFIPALAGQIYAMPGMQTPLHAVFNRAGNYNGFSSNYSGRGYSDMNFAVRAVSPQQFQQWVQKVKGGGVLDRKAYVQLESPSEREPIHYFATVEGGLFNAALNECAAPGQMCVDKMMQIDAHGGEPAGDTPAMKEMDMGRMVENQHGGQGQVRPDEVAPPSRKRPQ
jgi:cytochrome o ubiquinol oxidase subunit II